MCMIDGCEYDRVHNSYMRKARKRHRCEECERFIEASEPYRYTSGIDSEGEAFSHKLCQHCNVGAQWLIDNCGGWVRGGDCLIDDLKEHGEEYRRMDMYRLAIGMRRKWQRRGTLAPVPALPRPIKLGDSKPGYPFVAASI
jgi:hypothetical protein